MKWRNIYTLLISLALWYAIIMLCSRVAHSQEYKGFVDMDTIATIESSNNPLAYNKSSGAVGLCQITPVVLKEWNNTFAIKYNVYDLYNASVNKKIADWYMNVRIPQMIRHYKRVDSIDNRLIAYNAGIKYVTTRKQLPKETINYLRRYHEIQKKK